MYDTKEPRERLWQVMEWSGRPHTWSGYVVQRAWVHAKSRKEAKAQYDARYRQYPHTQLTASSTE
jgi:hypothetical protein